MATLFVTGCGVSDLKEYIEQQPDKQTMLLNRVIDGDTLEFYSNGEKITCRINGIDTPEKHYSNRLTYTAKQCGYSTKTVQYLGELATNDANSIIVTGRYYNVEIVDNDQYDRYVCRVELSNGYYYAQEMVRTGYAVVKDEYLDYNLSVIYQDLENYAKDNGNGLWYNYDDFMQCLASL